MDIQAKSVDMDMDMDMDGKVHIHGNPGLVISCTRPICHVLYYIGLWQLLVSMAYFHRCKPRDPYNKPFGYRFKTANDVSDVFTICIVV